jgi:hypothetical protein
VNNEELAGIIDREIANSIGYFDSKLATQRREAMEDYLGEPYGNEVEGRSQYVSRDVADTVEGIMPSIMRIFTSQDEICRFEPQGMEDEEGAKQATDYVNYVFSRQNNGFVILYTFCKDALLQKNGFCKVYWEEYPKKRIEEYENLTPEQLTALIMQLQAQGSQVEILEQDETSVKLEVLDYSGKVCLDPIPPEEVRVNKNATWDLQKCRFVAHERRMTASELREMGIKTDDLEPYPDTDWNQEKLARFRQDQEDFFEDDAGHEPHEGYLVRECYMLVDWDGDGIAERRMVLESGGNILQKEDGEDCNYEIDRIPIVTTTPILMPHKLYGTSIADLVSDLQLLKTTLVRQILDNMYLTNNSRVMALDGMVNIDDLLTVRPGGVVRVKTFDAVKPMQVPFFGAPAFQMLGYIDQVREVRTGQRHFQGVNPDALNKDISGLALDKFTAASMEKIELIARIFAETGIKEMMWSIFSLLQKHEKKAKVVRLRNSWVDVDPRSWADKYDLTVTVGLGTGSKAQFLQSASLIGQIQAEIVKGGGLGRVVTEQNVYNYGREVAETVMPRKSELFFTDPSKLPPPQPPPPDEKVMMQMEKARMQDKTKRDMKSIDFLTQVAQMAQGDPSERIATLNVSAQRDADARKFEHESRIKDKEMEPQRRQMEAAEMDTQQVMQMIQQLAQLQQQQVQTQQQQSEMLAQMMQAVSAERELVFDENGEPVRSRVVA